MYMGSSSTILSRAQARESLYFLSAEYNSPSDRGYDITALIPFPPSLSEASDPGQYCTCFFLLTADPASYLGHLPLPLMHLP